MADVTQFAVDVNSGVSNDRTTYGIETEWNLKVYLWLPDSIMEDTTTHFTSYETIFKVTIKDPCADNSLTIDPADEIGD